MNKISSILPSTKRVSTVDLKEAGPVRPGTPSFGRAEGVSTLRETETNKLDWKARDGAHAEIARDLADRFFSSRETKVASGPQDLVAFDRGDAIDTSDEMQATEESSVPSRLMDASLEAPEPKGLYPKGSFIDYVA